MNSWRFYGRQEQLSELTNMLNRQRWFFAKVTGRRRIGKTTLIQQAITALPREFPVFYVQIPDSEPAGVLSAVTDALDTFQIDLARFTRPTDLLQLAKLIEALARAGFLIVLDEFQYFNRRGYEEFLSYLQAAVDRLTRDAEQIQGGLVVLGSIHTEMMALLEDRSAPLYGRVTDTMELPHLEISSLLSILDEHGVRTPAKLLFLWNLFEGVPKFYRDCYEQNVLGADRQTLIRRIFFESSSPLRTEAENWFLRELRGRYDVILKLVAREPGRMHNELVQAITNASGKPAEQIGGYLHTLIARYGLIERKLPVFAQERARQSRYYVKDNFLRSWLAAFANPVSAIAFRPLNELVIDADQRLEIVEGQALEKMAGLLYEERNRKEIGDFSLTDRIKGYWDRAGIEIDLVAVDENNQIIRFGSCKRSPQKLVADVGNFHGHVARFLEAKPKYQSWTKQFVGIAPELNQEQRLVLQKDNILAQDLNDLTAGLS